MAGRKVIQIASDTECLTALCDDGTMWALHNDGNGAWHRILSIPQNEEEEEEQRTRKSLLETLSDRISIRKRS
jgi:hypothetical protein